MSLLRLGYNMTTASTSTLTLVLVLVSQGLLALEEARDIHVSSPTERPCDKEMAPPANSHMRELGIEFSSP